MNRLSFRTAAVWAAIALVCAGLTWLAVRPRPTLEGLDRLVAAGQHDAASRQLTDYLQAYPDDQAARILLARTEVLRTEPNPSRAIELLGSVHPANPSVDARVRAIRGEAYFLDQRYDQAEAEWSRAVDLDPSTPDVGWGLLNLYGLQGRDEDTNRLALRLYEAEPDPHDRLQLLLQMIRFDAHAIEPGAAAFQLEPVVRDHPGDLASSLAYASALVNSGRIDDGLARLTAAVKAHPGDPIPWVRLVDALRQAGLADDLAAALERAPKTAEAMPRVLAARGWLDSQRQDWPAASRALLRAFELRPWDPSIAFALRLALKQADRTAELAELGPRIQAAIDSKDGFRRVYDRINEALVAGREDDPSLAADYREVGSILRSVGRGREADLWDRLASRGPVGPE